MKKKIILLSLILNIITYSSDESKIKMRELIEQIKVQSKNLKYLIPQNGTDIYFNDGVIDLDFLQNINGVSQESLYYGVNEVNEKTAKEETKYLLKNLRAIKENGKAVFSVNYTNRAKHKAIIEEKMKENNFVGEAVPSYNANKMFNSINEYNDRDINSLDEVTNFLYLLNPEKFKTKKAYFNALKNTNHDMLIIEPSVNGNFFTKAEIEALKRKVNGGKRIVIAYFSIGEAEDYRDYWNPKWSKKKPSWIIKENPNWEGNYIIKYWAPEWKEIIRNYQQRLDNMGVDGYYLDTIDTYEAF